MNFGDKMEKSGTSILNLLAEEHFFLIKIQVIDIICLADLKTDGFLRPLLTNFCDQPKSLIELFS